LTRNVCCKRSAPFAPAGCGSWAVAAIYCGLELSLALCPTWVRLLRICGRRGKAKTISPKFLKQHQFWGLRDALETPSLPMINQTEVVTPQMLGRSPNSLRLLWLLKPIWNVARQRSL
jgi:hypothetical protein